MSSVPTMQLLICCVCSDKILSGLSIISVSVDSLPFGGVGQSGMGAYHGKWSFETFSHMKGSLIRNYNKDIEELTKFVIIIAVKWLTIIHKLC